MQWNYSEDTSKNCKTELQFFYCNMDKYFAIHSTMQKCRFKFTGITLHLEQQANVKTTVKNCKRDYSYSTVLCTFLTCDPYLPFLMEILQTPIVKLEKKNLWEMVLIFLLLKAKQIRPNLCYIGCPVIHKQLIVFSSLFFWDKIIANPMKKQTNKKSWL